MFELIQAGGWVMIPIIACSIAAMAIIGERFWSLQRNKIAPNYLIVQITKWVQEGQLDKKRIDLLRANSPLGKILAAGLINMHHDREMMKASIEETANHVIHELERFLNALGTIAEISPLLGLLGTVTGIINMLAVVGEKGLGNPAVLSTGLAEALITTAAGLIVAIPAYVCHSYFRSKVETLTVTMEQDALKLIDVLHGDREST